MAKEDQGYSTDQFLNFGDYENGTLARTSKDNPEFAYPGNRIPNIYDQPWEQTTNTLVQRGFIRGIIPEVLSESQKSIKSAAYTDANINVPKRRCFFQFNPSLILRSVQASTTVLNPLLQPASELLQPIPGQAAFEFQLLFNREREVSNHKMASGFEGGDPTMSDTSFYNNSLEAYGSKGSDYNKNHVSDLGVLSDLYILDSIIGQSITQDAISSLQAYWDLTKKNRTGSVSTVENQDGTVTTTTTKADGTVVTRVTKKDKSFTEEIVKSTDSMLTTDFNSPDTKTKLEGALGNSAFLSPLPVRIVFSSLFMVEGFVTASNVAFHKFSAQMVPTVCTVTLNVQALYLGFAKKESYVSKQLAVQLAATVQEQADLTKNQKVAREALRDYLRVKLSFLHAHGGSIDNQSLNQWFNVGTSLNWVFPNGNGTRFDSGDKPGLQIFLNEPLQKLVKTAAVQNIKIEEIELIFLNKDNLPKNYKTAEQIKDGVEKLKFPAAIARNIVNPKPYVIARATINTVKSGANNSADTGNSSPVSDIESPDIEKATSKKPHSVYWQSANITTTTSTPSTFFKENLAILMVVSVSANYPGATEDVVPDPVYVRKCSLLMNVDPDTVDFLNNCRKASSNGASLLNFQV